MVLITICKELLGLRDNLNLFDQIMFTSSLLTTSKDYSTIKMNYIRTKIGVNFHSSVTILRFGRLLNQIK